MMGFVIDRVENNLEQDVCVWNLNAPAMAIFSRTLTLIFDLDR